MNEPANRIEIRRAAAPDAKLVSLLGAVTFYEAYFEQDEPRNLANYIHESFALEKVRAELEDEALEFFIIFLDGRAVGYAKLRADSVVDCVENETAIELQRIYLVERVFGTGVGERLLGHCFEVAAAKGYKSLWLGVWEENRRAQRFYQKHGFRRVGSVTFPYGEVVGKNFVLEKVL